MALDLQTKLVNSFDFRDFENRVNSLLNNLLNVKEKYTIECDKIVEKIELNSNLVIVVNEKNHKEDIVELTFLYQGPVKGFEDPKEDGWWGISTIRSARNSPIKYALSAAIIASLSETSGNSIVDQEMIWTPLKEQHFESFIDKIRVKESFSDSLDYFKQQLNISRKN